MRVVAGAAGGRRLQAPPGRRLRPTSERVREAVFGTLGSLGVIDGARVLDLFAGTGALGIEALSRGAETATFVDFDAAAIAAIRANLETTGFSGAATVVRNDVLRFLDSVAAHSGAEKFDVTFADPPYAFTGWADFLDRVPGDIAVLESDTALVPGPAWATLRTRRYGDTVVTLVRRLRKGSI